MARFESTVQFAVNAQTNNVAVLDDFRKRVDGIGRSAQQSTGGIGALTSGIAGMSRGLATLGIGVSVAGLVGLGKSAVDLAGKLNDASAATTVAATRLDQYRQAGEQVGVSFETITGGLGKLNKSIAEAASGNADAAKAFDDLGISVTNNDGTVRKTSDIFEEFAAKVREAPNDAAIFEQGTKIMGRGFASLLPLLEEGSDGMTRFQSKFTAEGIKQLDDFGDTLNRTGEGLTGIAVSITEGVVPALNAWFKDMGEGAQNIQTFIATNKTFELGIDSIRIGLVAMGQTLNFVTLLAQGNGLEKSFAATTKRYKELTDNILKNNTFSLPSAGGKGGVALSAAPKPTLAPIPKPDASLLDRRAELGQAAAAQRSYAAERQRAIAEEARALKQLAEERAREDERQKSILSDFARQNQSRLDDLQLELQLMGKSRKEQEEILFLREIDNEARRLGLDLTDENIAKLEKEAEAAKKKVKVVLDEIEKNRGSFSAGVGEGLAKYLDDVNNLSLQASNLVMNTFQGAEDALIDLTTKGKLSFRDLADSIIADIARIAIRQSITGPLAGLLSGVFGGGGGGVGGFYGNFAKNNIGQVMSPSGFVNVTPNALGGVMTSSGPLPLNRYALGGVANSPQLALFGEGRGPEAFVPLPDGRRIPVAMKGGGGNTSVVVNVNMDSGAQNVTSTGQNAEALGKTIAAAVRSTIINEKRPGGLLS
jgi:lambda family phage tail tape measure protein